MWIVTIRFLHGPVTVAAERGGLLIRWLKPTVGSNPTWSSTCLYPNRQRERFERPYSVRSSRTRHTKFQFRRPRRPLSIVGLDRLSKSPRGSPGPRSFALLCIG